MANKYGAKRTAYNGRTYHSKAEANYAAKLDLLMTARGKNRVISWTPQVGIPLSVNGQLITTYIVDFEVYYSDRTEVHEVKGVETAVWKLKRKLFEALYPNAVLRIIKLFAAAGNYPNVMLRGSSIHQKHANSSIPTREKT